MFFRAVFQPYLRRMMTRKWLTNDEDFKQLLCRTELLSDHCSVMRPPHAQVRRRRRRRWRRLVGAFQPHCWTDQPNLTFRKQPTPSWWFVTCQLVSAKDLLAFIWSSNTSNWDFEQTGFIVVFLGLRVDLLGLNIRKISYDWIFILRIGRSGQEILIVNPFGSSSESIRGTIVVGRMLPLQESFKWE